MTGPCTNCPYSDDCGERRACQRRVTQVGQRGYVETIVALTMLLMAALVLAVVSEQACSKAWAKSGMPTDWGPIQGCLVQTPGGRWLPEGRVRDVDLTPAPPQPRVEIPR